MRRQSRDALLAAVQQRKDASPSFGCQQIRKKADCDTTHDTPAVRLPVAGRWTSAVWAVVYCLFDVLGVVILQELPQAQGSPPGPNIPARAPPRGPSGRPRQTPGRSGGNIPASTPRANRVVAPVPASCQAPPRPASPNDSPPGPSYAFVARSEPATAMDTGPAAPAGPSAGPTSAAAAAPSCTPTAAPSATPSVSPASSPAGPLAPTNPQ
ncbi:TPA: hypothetical protein ACH3X3_014509 [Trebouxia sp. C0006]